MTDILAKQAAPVLAQFASSNVLVAFDYDGTLAPIVSRPTHAQMRARTRRLLAAVARRYPCVIISGRSRDDVARRINAVPIWHVSGNHGLEPWGQDPSFPARVRRWVEYLRERLAGISGIEVEDKRYSLAIHYRRAPDPRRARAAIRRALARLRGYREIGGDYTVNLIPKGAPHKGTALERTRSLLVCDTAIYVGDDDTDEDAFAAGRADRLLAIRIGMRRPSRARYCLRDQRDIDDFLNALLALRPLRKPAAFRTGATR